jgi:hypothetical protein
MLLLLGSLLHPGSSNSGFAASLAQPPAYARTDHATIRLIAEDTRRPRFLASRYPCCCS